MRLPALGREASSHALDQERLTGLTFDAAGFTNLTQDHLDYHGTMENYSAAKARILAYQNKNNTAVLNRDDQGSWALAHRVPGRLVSFGFSRPLGDLTGTYYADQWICLQSDGITTPIMKRDNIRLRGDHNLSNVLAACAIAFAVGLPTTAMLAGAGIAGLAIGYASKDSLSNFTSGIFIAIFQPFRVGDFVDFRADYGQVEDLTLRHTIIRTSDNRRIIVPNNIMSMEPIINWSIREPEIVWTVDFDLEKAGDIDRARAIILEKARSHPQVLKDRPISVLLMSSRYSELILRLEVTIPGRNVAKVIGSEIREAVKKEFEVQGIPPAPTP